ncbi:MAG: ATPase, T2SS/T4P/T4SS family [Candidatus Omnitrophota bacterium]
MTKRMGELLVTKNITTSSQLDEALAEQESSGRSLSEILIKKGYANEEQVTLALSEQLGFACVDLSRYKLEPAVIRLLPEEIIRKYSALPIFKSATAVTVALASPLDEKSTDEIRKAIKEPVRLVFARPSQVFDNINREYRKESFSALKAGQDKEAEVVNLTGMDSVQIASLAPVVSIVDNLIAKAVELGASDIHLEPEKEDFYCRFRMDGVLHDMPKLAKRYEAAIISRIKIMSNMDISEKRLPQDGRIQTVAAGRSVDLRVSTFPTMYGENLVIRILDKTRSLIRLKDLGMPDGALEAFKEIIRKPHGIILVTGPTGSGKSTTLYAVMLDINSTEQNIVTMEDPIEYEIDRVRQSQVNVKAGLTFAVGLRSLVRQDPDVIMIGEVRDHETAEIAIHAALTGHLVFSTLHTNDAPSAATRLIDMETEPFLVSSALICVVAQRLLRVLCPRCKEAYSPAKELLDELSVKAGPGPIRFYREKGCQECRNSGYSGRIGIFEMLVPDDDIKRLIEKKSSAGEIRDAAIRKGMKTMYEDGIDKLLKGITSVSEVLRVTHEG